MAANPIPVTSGTATAIKPALAGDADVVDWRGGPASPGLGYSYYVVGLLAVAYMLSFMDRTLISLLIAPIKAEFRLDDTAIGALIGFGFVLLYSVLGLPFGALADRSDRRWLMIGGLVAWSLATTLSGFAGSFVALLGMRTLVGVGEATLSPAAYSTIADRFPSDRRGLAVGIYSAGVAIGGGLAMVFGGMLVDWAKHAIVTLPLLGALGGWRLALFSVGLLGFPLALLMLATLREAPRHGHVAPPPLAELGRFIADRPVGMIGTLAGFSFAIMANYVVFLWAPALFMRVHGMSARATGLSIGSIVGICGTLGILLSGLLSDRLTRGGMRDAPMRLILWAIVAQIPLMPLAFLVASPALGLLLLVPVMLLTTTSAALQGTALQLMTPARMRGRMIAIYLLCITLVGMGIGPLLIGLLSDHVFTAQGGLADAMATVSGAALMIATLILAITRRAARAMIV